MKKRIVLIAAITTLLFANALSAAEMDHSQMDHSQMDHSQMDHSQMDHSQMDHSQMDHSQMDHSQMDHSGHAMPAVPATAAPKAGDLAVLKSVPSSGKAREVGYDGRYGMESMDPANRLKVQCAQASRGLLMLDNSAWRQCGGKPEGVATGPTVDGSSGHGAHMGH